MFSWLVSVCTSKRGAECAVPLTFRTASRNWAAYESVLNLIVEVVAADHLPTCIDAHGESQYRAWDAQRCIGHSSECKSVKEGSDLIGSNHCPVIINAQGIGRLLGTRETHSLEKAVLVYEPSGIEPVNHGTDDY